MGAENIDWSPKEPYYRVRHRLVRVGAHVLVTIFIFVSIAIALGCSLIFHVGAIPSAIVAASVAATVALAAARKKQTYWACAKCDRELRVRDRMFGLPIAADDLLNPRETAILRRI